MLLYCYLLIESEDIDIMEYILETYNLGKKYKKYKAIDNVNMHIEKGAIYGLIGKNGVGKTTLMRLICGLQTPTTGNYSIYGISNDDPQIVAVRKSIGAIIETPSICTDMTAEDNLIEQSKIIGLQNCSNIKTILGIIGLTHTGKKKAKYFSLGMKQRLSIGVALVGTPSFVILDEPLNGLDPQGIIEIRNLILKLNKEFSVTFLISSHNLGELSKIATHYGFMDKKLGLKEVSHEQLEYSCGQKIQFRVNNTKECIKYLEENQIFYEINSNGMINIDNRFNISELIIALSKRNCIINEFHEKEETLESYYLNIIGGTENE